MLPRMVLVAPDTKCLRLRSQTLYYRSYKAEAAGQKPKATLVFHHGYGCYCAFYDQGKHLLCSVLSQRNSSLHRLFNLRLLDSDTFHHGGADYRSLQKRGFTVFTFDAHSFGKSEPMKPAYLRSYVQSPHHLVDDVYTYVQVKRWACNALILVDSGSEAAPFPPLHCQAYQTCIRIFTPRKFRCGCKKNTHAAGSGSAVPRLSPWPANGDGRRFNGRHGGNPDSHPQAGDVEGTYSPHSHTSWHLHSRGMAAAATLAASA